MKCSRTAAKFLGISVRQLARLRVDGQIQGFEIGIKGKFFYRLPDLEALKAKRAA